MPLSITVLQMLMAFASMCLLMVLISLLKHQMSAVAAFAAMALCFGSFGAATYLGDSNEWQKPLVYVGLVGICFLAYLLFAGLTAEYEDVRRARK